MRRQDLRLSLRRWVTMDGVGGRVQVEPSKGIGLGLWSTWCELIGGPKMGRGRRFADGLNGLGWHD
jgi:hypothetical protein